MPFAYFCLFSRTIRSCFFFPPYFIQSVQLLSAEGFGLAGVYLTITRTVTILQCIYLDILEEETETQKATAYRFSRSKFRASLYFFKILVILFLKHYSPRLVSHDYYPCNTYSSYHLHSFFL